MTGIFLLELRHWIRRRQTNRRAAKLGTGEERDLLAIWTGSRSLARAAYYNLIGAAITALAAVVTGVLAWQLQLGGERFRGNLRLHLGLGASAAVLIWLLTWWRRSQERQDSGSLAVAYWAVAFLTVLIVALTGHLGGFLRGVEVPN
jgi:uncharacterized membrane protein